MAMGKALGRDILSAIFRSAVKLAVEWYNVGWFMRRSSSPTLHDWKVVMRQFSANLRRICDSELVRSDEKAQRIIARMVGPKVSMKEIDAQMDLLTLRVGELLAQKTGDDTQLSHLLARGSQRRSLARFSEGGHQALADETAGRPGRTFLRL